MPEDNRRVGSLIDPRSGLQSVQLPETANLVANVDPHLERIQENVFSSYDSLVNVLDAQSQAKSADSQYRIAKAQAENEGRGGGLAEGLSAIGNALVTGYTAFQEVDLKKKQVDYEIKQQELQAKSAYEAEQIKIQGEQTKLAHEETSARIYQALDESVTRSNEYIQKYGVEQGTSMAQAELDQILNSEAYNNLPPDKKIELRKYARSIWSGTQQSQTDLIIKNREKIRAAEIDKARTYIKLDFGGAAIGSIRGGEDPNVVVRKFEADVEAWKQKQIEANGGQPLDPDLVTEIFNPIYSELAVALQDRYGADIKNYTEANRYVELEQFNASLEIAVDQGIIDPETGQPLTEARARVMTQQRAIQLGIPGYTDNLQLSGDVISSRQIAKLEEAKALDRLLNDNSSPIDPNTVVGQQALSASQGGFIFSSINGDAGSLALVAHIKQNRSQYPVHLQNLPERIDEFNTDRTRYLALSRELIQIEQKAYAITTDVSPETLGQQRVLVPPDTLTGAQGRYENVQGAPSPTALPEQREALLKEAELLKAQQVELQQKWANFGIDINNPANRSYLDRLEQSSQGVNQEASTTYGGSPVNSTPTPAKAPVATEESLRNRAVNNASRKNRPELYDSKGNKLPVTADLEGRQRRIDTLTAQSGDPSVAYFVVDATDKAETALTKLETLIASGVAPDTALQQVRKEYYLELNTDFINRSRGENGSVQFLPAIPGKVDAVDRFTTLRDSFDQQAFKLVNSYKYYLKLFQEQTRANSPPINVNPSTGNQTNLRASDYPQTTNPTTARNVGKPSLPTTRSNGSSNGLPLPVPSTATATYVAEQGNGGGRPSGIRITSSSDQVISLQGGSVVFSGTSGGSQTIIVKTPDGRYEAYSGLSQLYWKKGDVVRPGQTVGKTQQATTAGNGNPQYQEVSRIKADNGTSVAVVSPVDVTYQVTANGYYTDPRNGITYKYAPDEQVRAGGAIHKGIDLNVPVGSPVSSPFSGKVIRAGAGGTSYVGDSDPGTPGNQPQHTVVVQLDTPFTYKGTTVRYVYLTHLTSVSVAQGQSVEAGALLGKSGFAASPHLHLGFTGSLSQSTWLSEGDLFKILFQGGGKSNSFVFSTYDSNPITSTGTITPNGSSPISYLVTLQGGSPNASYQGGVNPNNSRSTNNGLYKISENVYLLPNNMVLDMSTGIVRPYAGEETTPYVSPFAPPPPTTTTTTPPSTNNTSLKTPSVPPNTTPSSKTPPPPPPTSSSNQSSMPIETEGQVVAPLLQRISQAEGDYNALNRREAGDSPGGSMKWIGRNLTDMTIGEIRAAQRAGKVGAVGAYQFTSGTLQYVIDTYGVDPNRRFDQRTQDELGLLLIKKKRPLVWKYITGQSDNLTEASQELAREWAAIGITYSQSGLPVGSSFYAGIAGNRASISPGEIQQQLQEARRRYQQYRKNKNSTQSSATGVPMAVITPNLSSNYASDYEGAASNNQGGANFNYQYLSENQEVSLNIESTATALGIPSVWLADIIAYRTDGFTNLQNLNTIIQETQRALTGNKYSTLLEVATAVNLPIEDLGREAGRTYDVGNIQWETHVAIRQTCSICRQMSQINSFIPHNFSDYLKYV